LNARFAEAVEARENMRDADKKDTRIFVQSHPEVLAIPPDPPQMLIKLGQVRRVIETIYYKPSEARRRVYIFTDSAFMKEAANSLLKILEEPPDFATIFLLTTNAGELLPTIRSRLQTITVHPPTEAQLQTLLNTYKSSATAQRQAYFLSGGLPGLLSALLADDEEHPLLASVATAKEILQKQPFERLSMADALSKQKETAYGVLEALERIGGTGLSGAAAKHDAARITQWHTIRKYTLRAREALQKSANAKLVLTNLFLNLR